MKPLDIIKRHAEDGVSVRMDFFGSRAGQIEEAAGKIAVCMASGGTLFLCGNGGSAADAQHLAGEFVNRFLIDRPPLPAVALSTDTSVLTAIGNDFGFNLVFAKQIRALGKNGDALLAISTSGNSPNVLEAIKAAREIGMVIIGLTGQGGGAMAAMCDVLLDVPSPLTPLVQETHIAVGHVICSLVDHFLFENPESIKSLINNEK